MHSGKFREVPFILRDLGRIRVNRNPSTPLGLLAMAVVSYSWNTGILIFRSEERLVVFLLLLGPSLSSWFPALAYIYNHAYPLISCGGSVG